MKRREFIAGVGGAAVAWPFSARAQQPNRVRRVGVLMANVESDPEAKARFSGFIQKLKELGWTDGRNLLMDVRWAGPDVDRVRMFAKELVGLHPDVIFAPGSPATAALQRETRTIPIVFVLIAAELAVDGFVASLPRPGGNITGFSDLEASMTPKWLELLTGIAPGVKQAGFMFNPDTGPYARLYFLPSFESAARSLKVLPIVAPVRSDAEIETVMASLGRELGSGLVVITDAFVASHHALIISLAARNNVPAVFRNSEFVRDGALLSYGPDIRDDFRRAASYVDRILRGAKPADLPIQLPVKFEMALNAKTAKALGLTIPPNLLAIADEVIDRRREFIAGLGSAAAAFTVAARAQQPALPVVGLLLTLSADDYKIEIVAFLQSLKEAGFLVGQNVAVGYRHADNQYDRLPALAADHVRRRVAVIVANGVRAALAAKDATTTIPIVFTTGSDPVALGLVASLNRPGANVTGITSLTAELAPKRLQLLRELLPNAAVFGVLVDPAFVFTSVTALPAAARTLGLQLFVVDARADSDLETAFAAFSQQRVGAVLVGPSSFYDRRREQLAALAARHALPALYSRDEFVLAGGLMSYGSSIGYAYHQVGVYTGRILKGEKPADLPVQQVTKLDLVINLKTAKTLGLTIPPDLLAVADEVIE